MAVITNSIGSAGGRDYSTLALWEAALPANAVTAGNSYVGECYNDSEFDLSTSTLTIGGTTTDSTHFITLTTASGQGFKDNAGAASNALRYNASNGVAIKTAAPYAATITITDAYTVLSNLQIKNTAGNTNTAGVTCTTTNVTVDSCIVQGAGTGGNSWTLRFSTAAGATVKNCLLVMDSTNGRGAFFDNASCSFINNTLVRPSNRTTADLGLVLSYTATRTVQNCAFSGFSTSITTGSGTSGSGNAITDASYPSGITGQTSLTPATEFVQPSNASSVMDWRLNTTSVKCKDNGTNSGAPSTDIIGQAISNTTRDAGAWELQQGGGATSYTLTASAGSYSVSGQAQTLTSSRSSAAAQGSYAVSGKATVLSLGRKLTAAQGSYAVSGQTTPLTSSRSLAATTGSYSVSGKATGLSSARKLTAAQGSYSVSGKTAGFILGKSVVAAAGSYALSGVSAALKSARKLLPTTGAYTAAGQSQSLVYTPQGSQTLAPTTGSYTVSGKSAILTSSRKITATTGTYAVSGKATNLTKHFTLTAVAGSYSVSGKSVLNPVNLTLKAVQGIYSLGSVGANLVYTSLTAQPVTGGSMETMGEWTKRYRDHRPKYAGQKVFDPNGPHRPNHPEHKTTEVHKSASILARSGGYARAESLTSKQRSVIATVAAKARWK